MLCYAMLCYAMMTGLRGCPHSLSCAGTSLGCPRRRACEGGHACRDHHSAAHTSAAPGPPDRRPRDNKCITSRQVHGPPIGVIHQDSLLPYVRVSIRKAAARLMVREYVIVSACVGRHKALAVCARVCGG